MDLVKVVLASGSIFSAPDEVAELFQRTELGKRRRVWYDEQNHYFTVECPLVDAERVATALTEVVRDYLHADGPNADTGLGGFEISRVRPVNDNNIWRLAVELANQIDSTRNAATDGNHLIQRHTTKIAFKYSEKEAAIVFSSESLNEVSRNTECDISIDRIAKEIRIGGWTRESIDTAEKFLATIQESYDRSTLGSSFDFVNDEGQKKTNVRLIKPTILLDPSLFAPGQPSLCELTTVEWVTQSRHWRISRKEQSFLPDAEYLFWNKPVQFMHTRQCNNPSKWVLTRENVVQHFGQIGLSIQQLGRTSQWAQGISETPLDPYSHAVANEKEVPSDYHHAKQPVQTTRVVRSDQTFAKSKPNSLPALATKDADKETVSADERTLEHNIDRPTIDFDKLKGTGRNYDITTSGDWPIIDEAHRSIMEQASVRHRSSISFELHFGHIYVYALTIDHPELRPQRKTPSEPFSLDKWPDIFRTKSGASGASTIFSPRLTSRNADVSFILDIKMGKNERIIERAPKHHDSWFEIHCRDPYSKSEAIVEVHDKGSVRIEGKDERLGGINIHHPARTWDCSWNVAARKQHTFSEQMSSFKDLIDNVYVNCGSSGSRPVLYSRANVEILEARLVNESVHRTRLEQIKFCLRNVVRLAVIKHSEDYFELSASSEFGSLNEHGGLSSWWEAKLVAPGLQRTLEENKEMGMGRSQWPADIGSRYLSLMLQLAGHLIPRMDNVGFKPPLARQ